MMINQELQVERVRYPVVVRTLSVSQIKRLSPNYVRIRLTGTDLKGFEQIGLNLYKSMLISST